MSKSIVLPNEILFADVKRQLQAGRTVTFTVRGWSMRPFLEHERDKVLLGPVPPTGLNVGDAVLAVDDHGRYLLHRIVALHPDDGCTLRGDGNVTGEEHISPGHVIGIVRGFYRPQGLRGAETFFSANGKAWKDYSAWWMSHSPRQRRLWLLGYRILKKLHIIP